MIRKPREIEDLIEFAEEGRLVLANVCGDLDITTDVGQMLFRILGATARGESAANARRRKRANEQRAKAGKAQVGGRFRMFGFERDGMTVNKNEAKVVKEMFKRRAAGESCTWIARDLSARGVRTTSGREWTSGPLSDLLKRPQYIGKAVYKGEVVGNAIWKPFVKENVFALVQTNLVKDSAGTGARKHLLSGISQCSKCLGA